MSRIARCTLLRARPSAQRSVVQGTIGALARQVIGEDVIWSEYPDERLYISHRITSQVTDMIATIFYGMLKVIRSTHNATRKALVARTEADPTALA